MPTLTLHTGFNKLVLKYPLKVGDASTPLQFSIRIPSFEETTENDVSYKKGELYQKKLNSFEQFVNHREYLTDSFKRTLFNLILETKEDVCVYCFRLPNLQQNLSYAISNKDGLKYIETCGKNDKQVSINQYIRTEMTRLGWF